VTASKTRRDVLRAGTVTLAGALVAGCLGGSPGPGTGEPAARPTGRATGAGGGSRSRSTGEDGPRTPARDDRAHHSPAGHGDGHHSPATHPREAGHGPHAPDGITPDGRWTDTPGGDPSGTSDADGDVSAFLADVSNFDGVVDRTGESLVRVRVGSEANGGAFGFSPAAVRVSTGTTVVWEWTGAGGAHNVHATDGSFESTLTAEASHTFRTEFPRRGTFGYVCDPHRGLGMKGAIVVE